MSPKTEAVMNRAAELADEMTEKLMLIEDNSKARIVAAAMTLVGLSIAQKRNGLPDMVILVSALYADAERHMEEDDE